MKSLVDGKKYTLSIKEGREKDVEYWFKGKFPRFFTGVYCERVEGKVLFFWCDPDLIKSDRWEGTIASNLVDAFEYQPKYQRLEDYI